MSLGIVSFGRLSALRAVTMTPSTLLLDELLDMARLADRVVRGVAHQDRHAAVRQALLYALHNGNGEPAEGVGRNQADSQTLTAMQAVREVIGAKSQLTRGRNDFLSRLAAKAAVVVERFRYRADAHIRRARDVPDGYAGATATGLGLSRQCRRFVGFLCHRTILQGHFTAPAVKPET